MIVNNNLEHKELRANFNNSNFGIITEDRNMLELLQLSETVAKSKAAILIQGEAGSGKRSLAQLIHQKSQRMHKNLEVFNCAMIARGEQEAMFFTQLERAHGGTFLLLEISKLAPQLQARLCQVLQDGLFLKANTTQVQPIDVRVIATSTASLAQLVKAGDFREDLYYRLNVVNLKIPALNDRIGDVEILAKTFARKSGLAHGKGELSITDEAIQLLNSHRWPGNVRELESTIERAVLFNTAGEIRARDIQIQNVSDSASLSGSPVPSWKPGRTLDEIERNVILEALKYHAGNRTHTAKALGISIRTLRNKLAEYRVMGINA